MTDRQYFLAVDNEQVGPIDIETVKAMARDGAIGPSTLVWFDGMADWAPLSSTELRSVLEGIAAPPPMRARPGASAAAAPMSTERTANASFAHGAAASSGSAAGLAPGRVPPGPILGIGFVDAIKRALNQYAVFHGRASRSEYWWFVLFTMIASLVLPFIPILGWIAILALVIPSIAVVVRRLHDTDRSGWWYLLVLIPLVGAIILIIFLVQPSQPGQNRFG